MKNFPHKTTASLLLSATLSFGAEKAPLIEVLKTELGLKAENIIQPQSKNETYISHIEECGLVTCYKHNIVLVRDEKSNTYFVSVLRTGEVIPFTDKTKISNGNKKVSKKSKAKISKAIMSFDSSATVILDDEDSDADVDCSTQFREIAAYGGSIEPVSKDIGTPKITYFSRDYLLKNGFWGLPISDTIPTGGLFVVQDFFCGDQSGEGRKMNFIAIAPEFEKLKDVDTNQIYRPKVKSMNVPGIAKCPESHNYFVFLNKAPASSPFRFILMGSEKNNPQTYVFDWRISNNLSVFTKK